MPREGVQLLDASEGNIINLVVSTVLVQRSPDLTSAENDAINLLGRLDGASLVLRVRDDPLETSILGSELVQARPSERMAEERLGEEDDEGCRLSALFG